MRIFRNEIFRLNRPVRKIAAPAAGNQNLPPDLRAALQNQDFPPALRRRRRAEKPRRARADNDRVKSHIKDFTSFKKLSLSNA